MLRKKFYFLIITIILLISVIIFAFVSYFLFTTRGSGFITKLALSNYLKCEDIDIKRIEGSLAQKLSMKDIEIKNLEWLPKDSFLRIQKLDINFTSLSLEGLNADIFNGQIKLPNSDTIHFHGRYRDASLDFNIYTKYIDVREVVDLVSDSKALKNISGKLIDLDIYAKGPYLNPELTGDFQIEEISRNDFFVKNCPTLFTLQFKDIKDELKLYGEVSLNSGVISGPKTAVINLKQSKILFSGDFKKPSFDLKGTSTVEDTKINITLKGAIDKPDLVLSSEPPFPQEYLLVMLATGKSWKGSEDSLSKRHISLDLARDFIDYFAFSGSGKKIAQLLGVNDISFIFEKQKKGVTVKKGISDKVEASYTIEQSWIEEEKEAVSQKIGGEYKITESISLEAQKELRKESKEVQFKEPPQTDDKVFLKYKKRF